MNMSIWRILDANANRAREALRVIEDYVRFTLDDAGLSAAAKDLRHDLAAALAPLDAARAHVMRDAPGDVGATLTGSGEYTRHSPRDVIVAAGKRLTEALRSLEEYGKTQDVELAMAVERVRYRAYDLEKRVLHVADAQARLHGIRVYVLITESLCALPWPQVVRAAASAGAGCFQLREPDLDDRALLARAHEFVALCREVGALGLINNRADIAVAAGADGVHVGQGDLPVDAARRVVGPQAIVGVSTHNHAEARAAIATSADYIAVGPMFATMLKPDYPIAGPQYLRQVRALTALPLVAIGGVTPTNASTIAEAGANAVAVCSAIIAAQDPAAATQVIRSRFSNKT